MSDDLRIAVLGVGMMGAFHVDALSKRVRGARVTVVNDFLADKAAESRSAVEHAFSPIRSRPSTIPTWMPCSSQPGAAMPNSSMHVSIEASRCSVRSH